MAVTLVPKSDTPSLPSGLNDPPDQAAAGQAADAKAVAQRAADKAQTHQQQTIKEGRVGADGKGEHGISALGKTDTVEQPGIATLLQLMTMPTSTAAVQPSALDARQALEAFMPLMALLGPPKGDATEALFTAGPGALPFGALAGQAQLLALAGNAELMNLKIDAPDADPEIVARVRFVQRLATVMTKTLAAQLDPKTVKEAAQSLGDKPLGILTPFLAQMPALAQALQQAFVAMKKPGAQVPGASLNLIEQALGKAGAGSAAFKKALASKSDKVMALLQAHLDGDTGAIAKASPELQDLVAGVMSWNDQKSSGAVSGEIGANAGVLVKNAMLAQAVSPSGSDKSFYNAKSRLGDMATQFVGGDDSTSASPSAPPSAPSTPGTSWGPRTDVTAERLTNADAFRGFDLSTADIESLIIMVMGASVEEHTAELRGTMKELQAHALQKQAMRKALDAKKAQHSAAKQMMDNEYYKLQNEHAILPSVTLQNWEDFRQVSWGDGVCSADGSYAGPSAQLPPLPIPLPSVFTTATPAGGATVASAASYGLSRAQLQDLQDVYNATTPKPADSFEAWLQNGVGLTAPVQTPQQAIDNLTLAAKAANPATSATTTAGGASIGIADLTTPGTPLFDDLKQYAELKALTMLDASPGLAGALSSISAKIQTELAGRPAAPALAKAPGGLAGAVDKEVKALFDDAKAALVGLTDAMKNVSNNIDPSDTAGGFSNGFPLKDQHSKDLPTGYGGFYDGDHDLNKASADDMCWSADGLKFITRLSQHNNENWSRQYDSYSKVSDEQTLNDMQALLKTKGSTKEFSYSQVVDTIGQLSQLIDSPASVVAGLLPANTTGAASGVDLKAEYGKAFDGQQLAFLKGLPANLPHNADGEPYDPGPSVLGLEKEALIAQFVAAGSLKLGLSPPELEAKKQAAKDQASFQGFVNENAASAATRLNHQGTLKAFDDDISATQDQLDGLSDMDTSMQMRLQLEQEGYSKVLEAMTNMMKKLFDTSQAIVENMK